MVSKDRCSWIFALSFEMQTPAHGERIIGATVGCLRLACEVTYTIVLLKYSSAAYVITSLVVIDIFLAYSSLFHVVVVD